jgi:hypothetical protein
MRAVDVTDEELLAYLELPEEERPGKADEFLDLATRKIERHRNRLTRHAKRILERCGLFGHEDDVTNEIIEAAWISLKQQMNSNTVNFKWKRPMPLWNWLLVIHGMPFKGALAGKITNYIRDHRKHLGRSYSELVENGYDMKDNHALDAEVAMVVSEQLRTALTEHQNRTESALRGLEASRSRDVFVYRLRTGTHCHRELNPDLIARMARTLPRELRHAVRIIVGRYTVPPSTTLDAVAIGDLLGLTRRRINQIVLELDILVKKARLTATPSPNRDHDRQADPNNMKVRRIGPRARPQPRLSVRTPS